MLRYLYFNQKGKLILFIVFSLLSSLFEIALSYVMLQSIDLAMSGKLSDALNYGLSATSSWTWYAGACGGPCSVVVSHTCVMI